MVRRGSLRKRAQVRVRVIPVLTKDLRAAGRSAASPAEACCSCSSSSRLPTGSRFTRGEIPFPRVPNFPCSSRLYPWLHSHSAAEANKKGKLKSWKADPKDFVCGVAMKDCDSSCVYMLVVSLCGNGSLMLWLISVR